MTENNFFYLTLFINFTARNIGEESIRDAQTIQIVKPLDSCESFDTAVLLMEMKPRFIILYDCDMAFVRQVEV